MNGLDLLAKLGEELQTVPAIIITGKGSEERVIAAIEAGAFWYIEKPLKAAVLRSLLDRALGRVRDRRQVAALTRQLRETGRLGDLIGGSKTMQDVMRIGRAGLAVLRVGVDHGRDRFGQGNSGANHSPALTPRRSALYCHQLFGDSRIPDGK